MKKLFLASVVANTIGRLIKILPEPPSKLTVAFIPTAADPYKDKWFVDEDRNKLKEKGFNIKEVDIKNKTEQELRNELKDVDIIFVAGGNTFYLLQKVRESGFDKIIKELIQKGIIYVGSSAGAVIAGPNIEPVKTLDDPSKTPDLDSFEGLHLVDFIVLPHYGEEKYKEKYKKIEKDYADIGFQLIPITDRQSIIIDEEGNYRIEEHHL